MPSVQPSYSMGSIEGDRQSLATLGQAFLLLLAAITNHDKAVSQHCRREDAWAVEPMSAEPMQ